MSALRVSIFGLGKLGASMAAAIADRGHHVIGLDVQPHAVEAINDGRAPVREPGLAALIGRNRERLRATADDADAIAYSDITFVVVPTPSDERGAFSLANATDAFERIGRALREKPGYHLVVLTSTVLPGSTRYKLIPALEAASGKQCGPDFGVCYSPEFIALGSVIHDFLNPDFTLIGEFDARAGAALESAYGLIVANDAPARRMTLENAELTKIALNSYVTTKITFANMLADLCERIPGGDVDVVSDALGLDRRIGRTYLTGAVGYGGPCFPRDNLALGFLARALDANAGLAETTDSMNRAFVSRVVERLGTLARSGGTIAVLGLAYKPFTNVIDESPGIAIALELARHGARVMAFDPEAGDNARAALGSEVAIAELADCLAHADAVVITTPDPMFRTLCMPSRNGNGPLRVLDCWRIAEDGLRGVGDVRYEAVGRSVDDAENSTRLRSIWQ